MATGYNPADLALSFMGQTFKGHHVDDMVRIEQARCLWCNLAVPGEMGVRYVCGDCDSKYMSYAEYLAAHPPVIKEPE